MKRVLALFVISLGVMCFSAQAQNLVAVNDVAFVANAHLADSGEDCVSDNCSCCDGHCLGGICTRQRLFGNLLGAESCLAQRGIVADLEFTQFYQGVASGGVEQTDAYGGKMDYMFTFLGEPLGLNKGFTAIMHAETRYGEDVNGAAGALALPNLNMLYPIPGENETAITGLIVMQSLNERVALAAGKFNSIDLFNMLYPNLGRGVDGFMNVSMTLPTTLFRTTLLSFNGAGVMAMKGPQIQGAVLVYDTNNSSTTSGLDNLFDQGAVVLGYWRFFTDIQGLPGSHGLLGNYSNRTYKSTDPLSWTIIPGEGIAAGQETGSWSLTYILDQTLWADCCNESRNVRLFSELSLADGNPNPFRWSGNVALQGTGLIRSREADTMGVGYFYDGLSSEFKSLVNAALPDIQDVQGVELYYNAAITPWFHLTGDLQIVENQNVADDTAIILGLRAKIDL